jgi:hypothetical protein
MNRGAKANGRRRKRNGKQNGKAVIKGVIAMMIRAMIGIATRTGTTTTMIRRSGSTAVEIETNLKPLHGEGRHSDDHTAS